MYRRRGQNLTYRSLFTGDEDKTLRIEVYSQETKPYVSKSIHRKRGQNLTYRSLFTGDKTLRIEVYSQGDKDKNLRNEVYS